MQALQQFLESACRQLNQYLLLWEYEKRGRMKYKFIAEGENCDTCNKLNGKVFDIKDAKVGVNLQPMHPNCDCMTGILDANGIIIALLSNKEKGKDGKNVLMELIAGKQFSFGQNPQLNLLNGNATNAGLSVLFDLPFVEWAGTTAPSVSDWFPSFIENIKQISKRHGLFPHSAMGNSRFVWNTFAEIILGAQKGYPFASAMMKHALQDKPTDVFISQGNDPYGVIAMIKQNKDYNDRINILIAEAEQNGQNNINYKGQFEFKDGDMKYTIHACKGGLKITGFRDWNGKWHLTSTFVDIYDYTEIKDFWTESTLEDQIGWAGNNLLTLSQRAGILNEFTITIVVEDIR